MIIYFLAFQTSSCFQYAVNSESEDSEQEIKNENPTCPKVNFNLLYLYYFNIFCFYSNKSK